MTEICELRLCGQTMPALYLQLEDCLCSHITYNQVVPAAPPLRWVGEGVEGEGVEAKEHLSSTIFRNDCTGPRFQVIYTSYKDYTVQGF